jgi:hypothetical protein
LAAAVRDPANLPDGMSPGLDADAWNDCDVFTFPNGCHVAEVEIDPQTGAVTPRFCGIELHPAGGSSAGLLTDVHARVIHQRRRPILGLYASGNAAAATEQGGYRERYAEPIWRPWERWRSGR